MVAIPSRRILLVTGARALDPQYPANPGTANARSWAWALLDERIRSMPAGSLVVTGGCTHGPDMWAGQVTCNVGKTLVEFRLDGIKWIAGRAGFAWANWGDAATCDRGRWPLVRNDAMVRECCNAGYIGWEVACVAFTAPWAQSHGTEHTIRLCGEYGIHVTHHSCPMDLSPYR